MNAPLALPFSRRLAVLAALLALLALRAVLSEPLPVSADAPRVEGESVSLGAIGA